MFGYIPDDIVVWAYRNKWLKDYDKREIYEYAVEVIMLNTLLLTICFLLSIFTHKMLCFETFLLIFIPLRIVLGGIHLKNSYMCMVCSVGMYMFIALFGGRMYSEYKWYVICTWCIILLVCLLLKPLEDKNYNKKLANIIIVADAIIILFCILFNLKCTAFAIIFNICTLCLYLMAKMAEKIDFKNIFEE